MPCDATIAASPSHIVCPQKLTPPACRQTRRLLCRPNSCRLQASAAKSSTLLRRSTAYGSIEASYLQNGLELNSSPARRYLRRLFLFTGRISQSKLLCIVNKNRLIRFRCSKLYLMVHKNSPTSDKTTSNSLLNGLIIVALQLLCIIDENQSTNRQYTPSP